MAVLLRFFVVAVYTESSAHAMSQSVSTAFITGANRGLGLEWVRQLVPRVEQLFATCRRPEEASELTDLEAAHPDTVKLLRLDVSEPESIENAVGRVRREADALTLLLNNAGVNGGGTRDTFDTVDQEIMMDTLHVNTVGPHLMTKAFSPLLRASKDVATVVNVTSQLGSISRLSGGGWQSYKVSKAALNMCTRLQAAELKADGVIVLAMHPGWVRTDMGGGNARLSTEASVAGMLEVIEGVTLDETGQFLAYDGRELSW